MKIVHICLCGPYTDGFSYQENLLAKYHKKMGYDVSIVASQWAWGDDGKLVKLSQRHYINADNIEIIRIPTLIGKLHNRLRIYHGLTVNLEQKKPDILFIHDCQFLDILTIARWLKKNTKVRVYVDNHVDYSNGAHGWLSKNILHKIIWRFCVRYINPYVRKFYGVLPARVDFLKELYGLPDEKCKLLLMGADDDLVEKNDNSLVRNRIRHKLGVEDKDFLIVTGGKIDRYKYQTTFLMLAIHKMEKENVKLILFGSIVDELKSEILSLVDGEIIKYVGWLTADETYAYFSAADLAVFPGRHSVLWEQAVGQGLPLVVKKWEGTQHIDVGGNVYFLIEDSENEILKVLQNIIKQENVYENMKCISENRGKNKFSYKKIAADAIDFSNSHI